MTSLFVLLYSIATTTRAHGFWEDNKQKKDPEIFFKIGDTHIRSVTVPETISGVRLKEEIAKKIKDELPHGARPHDLILHLPETHKGTFKSGETIPGHVMSPSENLSVYLDNWPKNISGNYEPLRVEIAIAPPFQSLLHLYSHFHSHIHA